MHDGSITSVSEVIDHYAASGRTISSGPDAGIGNAQSNLFNHGFAYRQRWLAG